MLQGLSGASPLQKARASVEMAPKPKCTGVRWSHFISLAGVTLMHSRKRKNQFASQARLLVWSTQVVSGF